MNTRFGIATPNKYINFASEPTLRPRQYYILTFAFYNFPTGLKKIFFLMEMKGNRICFYICSSVENNFSNQERGSQFSKVLWTKSIFKFSVE